MANHVQPSPTLPFQCSCGATFASEAEYLKHQQTHEKEPETEQPGLESPDNELDTSSGGEQGQTEEERRAWKHVRDMDAGEPGKTDSH